MIYYRSTFFRTEFCDIVTIKSDRLTTDVDNKVVNNISVIVETYDEPIINWAVASFSSSAYTFP